jgi:cytidine deaminase
VAYQDVIARARQLARRYEPSEDCSAGDVAAIIVAASGQEYSGVCVEFECGIGFCAEHAAAAEMLKARESEVALVVAVNRVGEVMPPCGRCREMLWQLNQANREALVVLDENTVRPLKDLLPYR